MSPSPIPSFDFLAIDVETANADFASICQIGLALFENGKICGTFKTYVDPEDYFDDFNIDIHGITPEMVIGSPTFGQLADSLRSLIEKQIVVHHTPFDRTSLNQAADRSHLPPFNCRWLDSAKVYRRTWETWRENGSRLNTIACHLGIEFRHHDALEDARAAGQVVLFAIEKSGISLSDWLKVANEPIQSSIKFSQAGNPNGSLAGEVIVFTGALSISRAIAAKLAAEAGCDVTDGVTVKTTILVVGDQDIRRLAGQEKSSKHRKAEQLIQKGAALRIVPEKDFLKMVK
jgi:DNA polymerase-3 subunit epsilon